MSSPRWDMLCMLPKCLDRIHLAGGRRWSDMFHDRGLVPRQPLAM
jgi:hypothetical protein